MFMWTVGYTVGDMMYIAQTTADQRRANWFSKVNPSLYSLFLHNPRTLRDQRTNSISLE